MKKLKSLIYFTGSSIVPALGVTDKIVDNSIYYLLTDKVLWQTHFVSLCKRVDSPDNEGDARRFFRGLIGHPTNSVEIIAVEKTLRDRRRRPK